MSVGTLERKNRIEGKAWLRNSVSVWDDIEKSAEERSLKHPAMFPSMLVERLIDCFATKDAHVLIDPFLGSGSALIGAFKKRVSGIGFEVVPEFAKLSYERLSNLTSELWTTENDVIMLNKQSDINFSKDRLLYYLINHDVRYASSWVENEKADILVTSPPYWIVHKRKRTADGKESRPYSEQNNDIGNIEDYNDFLLELRKVFIEMFRILKGKSYAIVNVMDLRYGSEFIPFHMDNISIMRSAGFSLEDIIIWNRAKEYNNLRPLGYPYKFIVNKIHEYLLIFRKQ